MIRSTFRCNTVTHSFPESSSIFTFAPIDGDQENTALWSQADAGSARVILSITANPYMAGDAYHFDFAADVGGDWAITAHTQRDEQLDIVLVRGADRILLRVTEPTAWAAFGEVGELWTVTISAA